MGDRSIQSSSGYGMGSTHLDSVDANSKPTDKYSELRTVDGKNVYLAPDDAAKFDTLDRSELHVAVSGHGWERIKAAVAEFLGE